jgi:hypothetical protein
LVKCLNFSNIRIFLSIYCVNGIILRPKISRVETVLDLEGRFDGGLSEEPGRESDLELDLLHDVAALRALELERATLEGRVVEVQTLGGERAVVVYLALVAHQVLARAKPIEGSSKTGALGARFD